MGLGNDQVDGPAPVGLQKTVDQEESRRAVRHAACQSVQDGESRERYARAAGKQLR
jgi:hypothetical protein